MASEFQDLDKIRVLTRPGKPYLFRKKNMKGPRGTPLKHAAQSVDEAEYIGKDIDAKEIGRKGDVQDLAEALKQQAAANNKHGRPVYSRGHEDYVTPEEQAQLDEQDERTTAQAYENANSDLDGLDGKAAELLSDNPHLRDPAAKLLVESNFRMSPEEAVAAAHAQDQWELKYGSPGQEPPAVEPAAQAAPGAKASATPEPEPEPEPQVRADPQLGARRRAAKQLAATHARTYEKGVVGRILGTRGFAGDYKMLDSAVPSQVIVTGDRGFEIADNVLNAAGDRHTVVEAMKQQLLSHLRSAIGPNGTLSQKALDAWRAKYAGAIRAIEARDPGFGSRFDDAAAATDRMIEQGARNKEALREFDSSSAARIAGMEFEGEIGDHLHNLMKHPTRLRQLVEGADQGAVDSLRQGHLNYMKRELSNADDAFDPKKFSKYVRDNTEGIRALHGQDGLGRMIEMSRTFDRMQRVIDAMKARNPGASNETILDNIARSRKTPFTLGGLAFLAGELFSGHFGAALSAGAVTGGIHLLQRLRASNLGKVNAMVADALANPDRFRMMSQPATKATVDMYARSLQRDLLRHAVTGHVVRSNTRQDQPQAAQ